MKKRKKKPKQPTFPQELQYKLPLLTWLPLTFLPWISLALTHQSMAPTAIITSEELSHNESGELQQGSSTYGHKRSLKLVVLYPATLARKGEWFEGRH